MYPMSAQYRSVSAFDPEIVPGLALAFGIGDESRDQLQDVLLRVDVGRGYSAWTFEVDGVQHF